MSGTYGGGSYGGGSYGGGPGGIGPLRLGPLAFPTALGPLTESLGDGLEAIGAAVVPGERRPRPRPLSVPVRGEPSDADQRATGFRLRRQLRQLLENARWRTQGLYLHWPGDPDLSGWLLLGGGDLTEPEPGAGVTFGEWELELTDPYLRGRPGTHRPARRLDLADRRTGLVPLDTRGLLYSTDHAAHPLPTEPVILPGDVLNVTTSTGESPASTTPGPLLDARPLFRSYAAADGEVLAYTPDAAAMGVSTAAAPLALEERGQIRVWDQGAAIDPAPTPAGDSDATAYGWERLYGSSLEILPALAADNGVCRLAWLGGDQGIALERYDAATGTYVRHARILHAAGVLEATVLEVTSERCVLEWRAAGAALRAILQRGWYGPRLEAYNGTLWLELEGGAATGTASLPAWVTVVTDGTRSVHAAHGTDADAWEDAPSAGPLGIGSTGKWTGPGPVVLQTAIGDDGPSDPELAALALVDAQTTHVLLARH